MNSSPSEALVSLLASVPVVPVLTLEDVRQAVPVARALVAGGLPIMEITLRTSVALDAVKAIMADVAGAIVGIGTATRPEQIAKAADAGAAFVVSPGCTNTLLEAAEKHHISFLPGVATASEVLAHAERGYGFFKFFPAEACGGASYLAALSGPFPDVRFCPTGGITPISAPAYLSLPNVVCVGGSWMVSSRLLSCEQWDLVERYASAAAALARPARQLVKRSDPLITERRPAT